MIKIGDFSKINRLTVKTLRFYDKLGLLKPSFVDKISGYRFYETDQLPKIQKIVSLKQIGFSLKEIKSILDDGMTLDELIKKLKGKSFQIREQIDSEKDRLIQLDAFLQLVKKEKNMDYHAVIKDLPEVIVASMRKIIADYDEFNEFYPKMGEIMNRQKLECRVPEYCFSIYHDGEYKEENIDVEICEAVVKAGKNEDGVVFKTVEAVPQAACLFHKGPYKTIGKAYAVLVKWIEDNGYEITGPMRESYIDGCWNKEDENEWLTEIQAPVRRK